MLDQLRKGDVIVVWKLDRLSSIDSPICWNEERSVILCARFQSPNRGRTHTHAGKMIMTVLPDSGVRGEIHTRANGGWKERGEEARRPVRTTAKLNPITSARSQAGSMKAEVSP